MVLLWIICAVLAAAAALLCLRLLSMRGAAREISSQFAEKLQSDTNTLISVSTGDSAMRRLASDINVQLGELREQRHRFTQGDAELKSAVTNISHDLRTPLTAISGYLELLDKTEKSETACRYVSIIKNRTEMLRQLTEELFRYSVVTSPEYGGKPENIVVNGVLEESILGFYAALNERGITPKLDITETKVIRQLDRAALSRIFSNLMNNAIKYSDGDLGITLTDSGSIVFANTASGLSQLQVERLFDRFYTVETARRSTGLGLSIARLLIEQMNGTITAEYKNSRLSICLSLPPATKQ